MNNENIPITPQEIVKTVVITSVDIRIISLELGNSVSIMVILKDENGNLTEVKNLTIEGEEYSNWGENDQYLIDLCIRKCGLEPPSSPTSLARPGSD
jgi:hypothetical protein